MTDHLLLPTEPTPPSISKRAWIIGGAAVAVLVTIIITFILVLTLRGNSEFTDVQKACDPSGMRISVEDDNSTLLVNSVGGDANADQDIRVLACVVTKVHMPMAVVSQLDNTRGLDGRQAASWDHYKASWTYFPDDGLDMILQQK